jgi:hypothetical protein
MTLGQSFFLSLVKKEDRNAAKVRAVNLFYLRPLIPGQNKLEHLSPESNLSKTHIKLLNFLCI